MAPDAHAARMHCSTWQKLWTRTGHAPGRVLPTRCIRGRPESSACRIDAGLGERELPACLRPIRPAAPFGIVKTELGVHRTDPCWRRIRVERADVAPASRPSCSRRSGYWRIPAVDHRRDDVLAKSAVGCASASARTRMSVSKMATPIDARRWARGEPAWCFRLLLEPRDAVLSTATTPKRRLGQH
jgi:hypothetical protein